MTRLALFLEDGGDVLGESDRLLRRLGRARCGGDHQHGTSDTDHNTLRPLQTTRHWRASSLSVPLPQRDGTDRILSRKNVVPLN
jgi:hypothetical protein